ncbi:uncharacterized protein Fot_08918 [Forsythia ovata]|uniref:C2 NT-type domain-containing protein n=1 Tax=Forsythia ovata TaxID=205694 RepID=A0ABD1WEY6_9LAMI
MVITRSLEAKAFHTSLPLCKENFLLCRNGEPSGSTRGFVEAHADDGFLEIFGLKHGWHASIVMAELISVKHIAQASSIRFELRREEWAEAYMQMDGEPWKQPMNKEFSTFVEIKRNLQPQKQRPGYAPSKRSSKLKVDFNDIDESDGSTQGSSLVDGRIEFNKSSRLPVTLLREMSIKSGNGDTFQKNCLKFNLYKPRSNKIIKGQLLGTAVVALAEYGVVEESLSINAPINCKRTYKNTTQPLLFLEIQLVKRREASMDRNHSNSVSAMMSKEYAEESDDDSQLSIIRKRNYIYLFQGTVYA